jgi:transcriptional regulatory protein RtcR
LLIDRFEFLHQPRFIKPAQLVAGDIRSVSPETDVRLHAIEVDDAWEFEGVYGALHDFARRYPFNVDREDYLIHITTGTHVTQICMFLLTEAHYLPGRLVQTSPPERRDPGKPGRYAIIDLDLSRYDRIARRFEREAVEDAAFLKSGIATRNKAFNQLIARIERVAIASRAPILLMGPTGAGKSQLARRIHELKKAKAQIAGPFVEVNCATVRGEGAMSALFGHVKGAFTGALQSRAGLLREADGGILFLDEIGELGADEQAMLLRAVEEKTFYPLGSDREARSDFQLIAGTNRDLAAEAAAGRFRGDLLARIDLWTFRLPGLAERREDIEPNLDYELDRFARRSGKRVTFAPPARARLLKFARSPEAAWTANFRDLSAAVTRMATLAPGGRITADLAVEEIGRLRAAWAKASGSGRNDAASDLLREVLGDRRFDDLDPFDRVQLAEVVRVCRSSRSLSDAGRKLFAASRARKTSFNDADRLRKYMAKFGLSWSELAE